MTTRQIPQCEVRVDGVPAWLDVTRLLGDGAWRIESEPDAQTSVARARLSRTAAADLAARLRGVGLDGRLLTVRIQPPLGRDATRAGRTRDARARRDTTVGFAERGARWDDEGRISLTPESLALTVGRWAEGRSVIDAGCGVGGNAIGFARAGSRVLAIEQDAARARLATHNAATYGVSDRVEVLTRDALAEVRARAAGDEARDTILFCDPPWGANWNRERCEVGDFPLLVGLLELRESFGALWAKLPPSFATRSWPGAARANALFGEAEGDRRRVKFVLLRSDRQT